MNLPSSLRAMFSHPDRSRFCEGALLGLTIGVSTLVVIRDPSGAAAEMLPAVFLLLAMFIVRRAQSRGIEQDGAPQ